MPTYFKKLSSLGLFVLSSIFAQNSLQADPVTLTSSISPQGANYLYDFSITNNSSADPYAELVNIDFPSLPSGSVVGDAVAPSGFGAVTDDAYILFDDDNALSFPVGVTTGGFQFVSTMKFGSIAFEALYLNSAESQSTVFTGTLSPGASSVPEPGTFGLLAVSVLALRLGSRRLQSRSRAA